MVGGRSPGPTRETGRRKARTAAPCAGGAPFGPLVDPREAGEKPGGMCLLGRPVLARWCLRTGPGRRTCPGKCEHSGDMSARIRPRMTHRPWPGHRRVDLSSGIARRPARRASRGPVGTLLWVTTRSVHEKDDMGRAGPVRDLSAERSRSTRHDEPGFGARAEKRADTRAPPTGAPATRCLAGACQHRDHDDGPGHGAGRVPWGAERRTLAVLSWGDPGVWVARLRPPRHLGDRVGLHLWPGDRADPGAPLLALGARGAGLPTSGRSWSRRPASSSLPRCMGSPTRSCASARAVATGAGDARMLRRPTTYADRRGARPRGWMIEGAVPGSGGGIRPVSLPQQRRSRRASGGFCYHSSAPGACHFPVSNV